MKTFLPHGVYAASTTPLNADLTPDHGALTAHSRWLLKNGCDGLGILGTTGEANSIGLSDRLTLITHLAKQVPPERLMPGVGTTALADTELLIKTCLDAGIVNVLCLPPFYYKPLSDAQIEDYFTCLLNRIGDPRLRLYLYHIPQVSGVPLSVAVIQALRKRFGEVVAGIKDSGGDFANMQRYAAEISDFRVFAGSEQFLKDILDAGGVGCISATTNITAAQAQAVYRDRTQAAQDALTPLRLVIQQKPFVPAVKGLLEKMTGTAAHGRMLPPHLPLPAADIETLAAQLAQKGLPPLSFH